MLLGKVLFYPWLVECSLDAAVLYHGCKHGLGAEAGTHVPLSKKCLLHGSNPPWKGTVRRTLGFIFLGKPFAAAY
jgi:hypothetical protein